MPDHGFDWQRCIEASDDAPCGLSPGQLRIIDELMAEYGPAHASAALQAFAHWGLCSGSDPRPN